MTKELKESGLAFIVYAGTIGAIMGILPECLSPRGRNPDRYFELIEWIQFVGDALFTVMEVLMMCFVMKKIKTDNYSKPSSTMLSAFIALSILTAFSGLFEMMGSSNDFWEVVPLVYVLMLVVVGIMFLYKCDTKAIGISMFCVVVGAIITMLIADPDNHKKWIGILTAAPYIAAVAFYFNAMKGYLMDKPLLVGTEDSEDTTEEVSPE